MPLTIITVAAPDRSGSGRGVPVPSITIWVPTFDCGLSACGSAFEMITYFPSASVSADINSVELDPGSLDDPLPFRGTGLEPVFSLGAPRSHKLELLGAKPRL